MGYSKRYGFYYTDRKDYDRQRQPLYMKHQRMKKQQLQSAADSNQQQRIEKYSKAYGFYFTDRKDYDGKKYQVLKARQEGNERPIAIEKLDNILFEQSNNNEFHMSKWDKLLEDLGNYIKGKEKGNYYGDKIQVIDLLRSSGDLGSFCRGNAIKYIIRAGRKAEMAELDLFKAIHYILIMILENEDADKQTNS